ncbi:transcriptional regulator [Niabella ginsenosidivorans]|uniref:Transcriptional regulator n=1 Tax=Niabella ginsenosidivorans TaxID=1176587 RepID=A0A1A9I5C6_9BACT|nr:AraC family transcriptional regulator [Niabella ginsenosidivorans]ANH81871.1 transcriptional regulator [Niabella ginsenosidivorans]
MLTNQIEWEKNQPPDALKDFVESFWMLANHSDTEHQIIVLPDGRLDIIFSMTTDKNIFATLKGLETEPQQTSILPKTRLLAVSFKLLAVEYLLDKKVDSLLNLGIRFPAGFWDITANDCGNFDLFSNKIAAKITSLIKPNIDNRKRQLFELIDASNGTLTVKELSERVFWSSRQINRYFNHTFGISLKSYCKIFRFKSSLSHIKKGKLFPELNYSDQNHFIKEVKKMSGVTPKELSKNENDRFLLLSTLQTV